MKVEVSTSGETWHEVPFTEDEGGIVTVKISDVYDANGQFGTFQIRTEGIHGDPFFVTPDPVTIAEMSWKPKGPRPRGPRARSERTEALRNLEVACARFVADIRRVVGGALVRLGRFVTSIGQAIIDR